MKRWNKQAGRHWLRRVGASDHADERKEQEAEGEKGLGEPKRANETGSRGGRNANGSVDQLVGKGAHGEVKESSGPEDVMVELSWDMLHGSRSMTVSALAGIVLLVSDFVDPGQMSQWAVYGCCGVYVAGVMLFFSLERRDHRKGRASLPPDRSGGGRQALVFVALVFLCTGGDGISGLAGWIAYSALLLGSWSDGAWIAIASARRGKGFWRTWYELAAGEREARRQCWAALFGGSGR